jgi:glutamyl-tRNA synthetase
MVKDDQATVLLDAAADAFGQATWEHDALRAVNEQLAEQLGRKPRKVVGPLYVALTGRKQGPPLFELMGVLGRDETVERLRAARARV